MTTYRKDLKMYVRYDKLLGRIIPSDNILSRVKPKVGNWTEITADECCGGCVPIYVCNAGTEDVNGLYTCGGIVNNKPFYTKGIYRLSWGEYPMGGGEFYDEWDIWDDNMDALYYSGGDDNTATPNLAEYWLVEEGDSPAPTVQLDECGPYSCLCESTLTVGGNGRSIWGYLIETYGYLTPNCSAILALVYFTDDEYTALILVSTEEVKDCMLVTIDGTDYSLQYVGISPYGPEYVLNDIENPFPEPGNDSIIIIDCSVDCPTTTTTTIEPTTTTTTTFIPCVGDVCETLMTVGQSGPLPVYGYSSGEGGIGTIDPNCPLILTLTWNGLTPGGEFVGMYSTQCFTGDVTVEIGIYQLTLVLDSEVSPGVYLYQVNQSTNPFPGVGEEVVIRICGTECTTTTTTTEEETTTTTTTVDPG